MRTKQVKINEIMESEFVTVIFEDVVVVGQVTCRQKDFISVQMISPYWGWEKYSSITGPAKAHCSYLTSYDDEVVRDLLRDNYIKIRTIDHSIARYAKVYDHLQAELKLISKMPNSHTKWRLNDKVKWWFYSEFIFATSVTGIVASLDERKSIEEILKAYKKEGRKTYLTENRAS